MTDALATSAIYRKMATLVDGTVRVTLDLDCELDLAAKIFGAPGDVVAVAKMSKEGAAESVPKPQDDPERKYSQEAKALKLSSFFRSLDVWRSIGTDDEFRAWIQKQACCVCGGADWVEEIGEHRCEAAHVRRAGESGTGYKASYACVPLCREHHTMQHNFGEGAAVYGLGDEDIDDEKAKEFFDKQRIEYVSEWAWKRLKWLLGYDSLANVEPIVLRAWAGSHGIEHYLPQEYR